MMTDLPFSNQVILTQIEHFIVGEILVIVSLHPLIAKKKIIKIYRPKKKKQSPVILRGSNSVHLLVTEPTKLESDCHI